MKLHIFFTNHNVRERNHIWPKFLKTKMKTVFCSNPITVNVNVTLCSVWLRLVCVRIFPFGLFLTQTNTGKNHHDGKKKHLYKSHLKNRSCILIYIQVSHSTILHLERCQIIFFSLAINWK